jgi:hypothetical protein
MKGMTTSSVPQIAYETGSYEPGACNIGPAEIARRRRAGVAGISAALVLAAGLLIVGAPPMTRIVVALPLSAGAVGLLQARYRFCVGFAVAGLRNFGPLGAAERVTDRAAHRADLQRAGLFMLAALAIGVGGGVALALLPG